MGKLKDPMMQGRRKRSHECDAWISGNAGVYGISLYGTICVYI